MATVRTSCPMCSSVIVDATEITIRRPEGAPHTECVFACPACGETVVQAVGDKMVPVLVGAGCTVDPWPAAAELLHPSNGAITEAEIAEFVSALDAEDWHAELQR